MIKGFPIDFVRQVIEQTLLEEHLKNYDYFGGKDQVNLFSFYEQLVKEDEVNRYTEMYRDLVNQQNRTGLIMNGTIIAPENPTITNIHNCLIIPMSFTCSFRVRIEDRDDAIKTINHLIEILKGRKQDIAEFDNGELFKVGTIGNAYNSVEQGNEWLRARSGCFLGTWDEDFPLDTYMNNTIISDLDYYSIQLDSDTSAYFYLERNETGGMIVVKKVNNVWTMLPNDGTYKDIVFPPAGEFTKYKLSMSFDSIRCDEPRNLNGKEYCTISFGGSATLVNQSVALGNDLVRIRMKKSSIKASTDITINDTYTWLEPLEMPSGNSADTQVSHLVSNNFITNSHTDAITPSLQYTFICDKSIELINQWFDYARYGIQGTSANNYLDGITPNIIYEINEMWIEWGIVYGKTFKAKIVESIDIENTESDTLTITIPLQVQGEN